MSPWRIQCCFVATTSVGFGAFGKCVYSKRPLKKKYEKTRVSAILCVGVCAVADDVLSGAQEASLLFPIIVVAYPF